MMSVEEVVVTALLFSWVIFVAVVLTRKLYGWTRKRGVEHFVAVYYNKKVIHTLAAS